MPSPQFPPHTSHRRRTAFTSPTPYFGFASLAVPGTFPAALHSQLPLPILFCEIEDGAFIFGEKIPHFHPAHLILPTLRHLPPTIAERLSAQPTQLGHSHSLLFFFSRTSAASQVKPRSVFSLLHTLPFLYPDDRALGNRTTHRPVAGRLPDQSPHIQSFWFHHTLMSEPR